MACEERLKEGLLHWVGLWAHLLGVQLTDIGTSPLWVASFPREKALSCVRVVKLSTSKEGAMLFS